MNLAVLHFYDAYCLLQFHYSFVSKNVPEAMETRMIQKLQKCEYELQLRDILAYLPLHTTTTALSFTNPLKHFLKGLEALRGNSFSLFCYTSLPCNLSIENNWKAKITFAIAVQLFIWNRQKRNLRYSPEKNISDENLFPGNATYLGYFKRNLSSFANYLHSTRGHLFPSFNILYFENNSFEFLLSSRISAHMTHHFFGLA